MADKAFFISDLHLGSETEPNAFVLLQFLRDFKSREQITHLFLVGDIFDLWIASHDYFKQKFKQIIAELIRLKKMGVEIHYFEGNHDLYLKTFFADELGFHVHEGPTYFNLSDRVIRVEHGDQMDPSDKGYLFLRWLLRTPVMKWLAPRLPSGFVVWLGEKMSHASRKYTSDYKVISQDGAIQVLLEYAELVHGQSAYNFLITGHVHVMHEHKNSKYTAVNLGSWFDGCRAYVMSNGDGQFIQLK